jgi:hypothetical protein
VMTRRGRGPALVKPRRPRQAVGAGTTTSSP